jgi:hypothetical protein
MRATMKVSARDQKTQSLGMIRKWKSIGKIRNYSELRKFVREFLRTQHPEWIRPDGSSPICDAYDSRLASSLALCALNGRRMGT